MAIPIRRRELILALGGAVITWPIAARAQQAPIPAVGFLHSASAPNSELQVNGFRQGLANAGYVEGRNVAVDIAGPKIRLTGCRRLLASWSAAKSR